MTHCCTHACNQGRDCPHRLWERFNAATIRADRRRDRAPYLRITALAFAAAALMAWGIAA